MKHCSQENDQHLKKKVDIIQILNHTHTKTCLIFRKKKKITQC